MSKQLLLIVSMALTIAALAFSPPQEIQQVDPAVASTGSVGRNEISIWAGKNLVKGPTPTKVGDRFATLAKAVQVIPTVGSLEDDLNSAVLQYALDRAGDVGDLVELEPGLYALTRGLKVNAATDGWRLGGRGTKSDYSANQGGVVLRFVGLSEPAIESIGAPYPISERKVFSIRDVAIESSNCSSDGIVLTNSQRYTDLSNVIVKSFSQGVGLKIGSTWINRLSGVHCRENRIGLEFFESTTNSIDFCSCYFGQNREYGIAFSGSGLTTCNFFGGAIEGNGSTMPNGAQIFCNSPVSGAINFVGTYVEWGNNNAADDATLLRVGSKQFAAQSLTFFGCYFYQANAGAITHKETAVQDVHLVFDACRWRKFPARWFSGATPNSSTVRVEGSGGRIPGFGDGNNLRLNGDVFLTTTRLSDPRVAGQLWTDPADGYALKVSQGAGRVQTTTSPWICVSRELIREDFGFQLVTFHSDHFRGSIVMRVGVAPENNFEEGRLYDFPIAAPIMNAESIEK